MFARALLKKEHARVFPFREIGCGCGLGSPICPCAKRRTWPSLSTQKHVLFSLSILEEITLLAAQQEKMSPFLPQETPKMLELFFVPFP
jgi:hypothetical protein